MTLRQCIDDNGNGRSYSLQVDDLLDNSSMYNIDFIIINLIDLIKENVDENTEVIDRLIQLEKFQQNFIFANNKLLLILSHLNFDLNIFKIVLKIFYRETRILSTNFVYLLSFKLSSALFPVLINIANLELLTNCSEYIQLICELIPICTNNDIRTKNCNIPNTFLIILCNILKEDLESDAVENIIHLLLVINDLFCIMNSEENPIPFLINSNIINKIIIKFNRSTVIDNKMLCLKMMNVLICSNSIHLYMNDLLVFREILVREFIEGDINDFNYHVILLKVLYRIMLYLQENDQHKVVLETIKALKQSNLDENEPNNFVLKNLISDIGKLDNRPAVPIRRKR
ncbi:hypothetical protein QEN19_001539 [Hanseniaspora menglaensis]